MKLCRALGLAIGIATFQREVDDAVHIGGSHLVRRVLGAIGAGDLVSDRDVVALNAVQYAEMIRNQETYTKNDLIRVLFERRGMPYNPGSTLLIDDTRRNVESFVRIGGHGLLVEGGQGRFLVSLVLYEREAIQSGKTRKKSHVARSRRLQRRQHELSSSATVLPENETTAVASVFSVGIQPARRQTKSSPNDPVKSAVEHAG